MASERPLLDWDTPQTTKRGDGCLVCGEDTEGIAVQIVVRKKQAGVASKQRGLCKAHAEEKYAALYEVLESRKPVNDLFT
jgi:hypothetical protein